MKKLVLSFLLVPLLLPEQLPVRAMVMVSPRHQGIHLLRQVSQDGKKLDRKKRRALVGGEFRRAGWSTGPAG